MSKYKQIVSKLFEIRLVSEFAENFHSLGLFDPIENRTNENALQFFDSRNVFLTLHYDLHLEKLGASLDRCFSLQEEWERLRSEGFLLLVELNESLKQHEISVAEIADGLWNIEKLEAEKGFYAAKSYGDGLRASLAAIQEKSIYYSTDEAIDKEVHRRGLAAFNSGNADYKVTNARNKWEVEPGGAEHTRPEWLKLDEIENAKRELLIQRSSYNSELARIKAEIDKNDQLKDAAEEKFKLSDQQLSRRKERLEATHFAILTKAEAMKVDGSPLDYSFRVDRIASRFALDIQCARVYALGLYQALEAIFGYTATAPRPSGNSTVNELYSFVSEAIEYLTYRGSVEIVTTIKVSLKQKLNTQFSALLAGKTQIPVEIVARDLPHLSSMMIIGVSFIAVGASVYNCDVELTTPDQSYFDHPDGGAAVVADVPRISARQSGLFEDVPGRTREPLGLPMLHNLSPYGKWNVELIPSDNTGLNLQDLLFEMKIRGFVVT